MTKAPLKPFQKIDALKTIVLPKMIHQLRLADVGLCKLKILNRKLKIWFKKTLHLAEWCPDSWVHSEKGGGLSNILELILKCRKKASEKMACSSDEVSVKVGISIDDTNRSRLEKYNNSASIDTNRLREHWETQRMIRLRECLNGSAMLTIANSVVKRSWLWTDRFLDGRTRTRCCQMMSGTIPSRINLTRGVQDREVKLCRRCKSTPETDLHILSSYPKNKGVITKCHDHIVSIVTERLLAIGKGAVKEKTWRVRRDGKGMENIRPDISVQDEGKLLFIEITCPYEKSTEHLNQRMLEKDAKYDWVAPSNINNAIQSVKIVSLAIGCCGTITEMCKKRMKDLHLDTATIIRMQKSVMKGSSIIVNVHINNG